MGLVCVMMANLLSFAVLSRLELCDLDLNLLLDASLKLRAIAKHEEDLQPHEHGSKEDGLDEVVEQSRRPSLKGTVSDEL